VGQVSVKEDERPKSQDLRWRVLGGNSQRWAQPAENWVAFKTLGAQGLAGTGADQRREPRGGWAKGMPWSGLLGNMKVDGMFLTKIKVKIKEGRRAKLSTHFSDFGGFGKLLIFALSISKLIRTRNLRVPSTTRPAGQ